MPQDEDSDSKKPSSTLQKYSYKDFSNILDTDNDEQTPDRTLGCLKDQKLPTKLNYILSNPNISHIISWMPHGRAWKVVNTEAFADEVMPIIFEHSNYKSFIRLVNAWGFRRISSGPDQGSYYHELFLRGRPHLYKRMRRLTIVEKKLPAETQSEPDFYEMDKENPLPTPEPIYFNLASTLDDKGKKSLSESEAVNAPATLVLQQQQNNAISHSRIQTWPQYLIQNIAAQNAQNVLDTIQLRQHYPVVGLPMTRCGDFQERQPCSQSYSSDSTTSKTKNETGMQLPTSSQGPQNDNFAMRLIQLQQALAVNQQNNNLLVNSQGSQNYTVSSLPSRPLSLANTNFPMFQQYNSQPSDLYPHRQNTSQGILSPPNNNIFQFRRRLSQLENEIGDLQQSIALLAQNSQPTCRNIQEGQQRLTSLQLEREALLRHFFLRNISSG